jgi:CDP-diacylglycerol--glycerol-3-phosphate 3-phosphatidyltransferase
MKGLYALKPWFSRRLHAVRGALIRHGVSPNWITAAGICCGLGAGAAMAFLPVPLALLPVSILVVALIAGMAVHLPLAVGVITALASSVPSWISLAGAAAGLPRVNSGPMGKTERCLVYVITAGTGWYLPGALLVAAGSVLTAGLRYHRLATLDRSRPAPGREFAEAGAVGESP